MSSAERNRRYRQRRRDGVRVVPLALHHDVLDDLIERHLLAGWDEGDPRAVADAIRAALEQWREVCGQGTAFGKAAIPTSDEEAPDVG